MADVDVPLDTVAPTLHHMAPRDPRGRTLLATPSDESHTGVFPENCQITGYQKADSGAGLPLPSPGHPRAEAHRHCGVPT